MARPGEKARTVFLIAVNVLVTILTLIPWETVASRLFMTEREKTKSNR